jgi:hypothetical protein
LDTTPALQVKWCRVTRETRSLIRFAGFVETVSWFAIVLSFLMQISWVFLQRCQSKLGNVEALMLRLMLMSLLGTRRGNRSLTKAVWLRRRKRLKTRQ